MARLTKKFSVTDLYLDIQLAWIKEARKNGTGYSVMRYQFTEDFLYLGNGFFFYKVPRVFAILEPENITHVFPEALETKYDNILDKCEYFLAEDTGMRKEHHGHNLIILRSALGVETAVDEAFLKVFKGFGDYNTGRKSTDPVVLTWYNGMTDKTEVLAFILPVNLGIAA